MQNNTQTKTLNLSKTLIYSLYFASFVIPFTLGGPQLLVGTLVNSTLFLLAITDKKWSEILPVIILPSLATISRGLIFSSFTPLLLYMIPAIWTGNALLIFTVRNITKISFPAKAILASFLKAFLLYATAHIFVQTKVLSSIFLTSMGFIQFATASLAGLITWSIKTIQK